MALTAEAEGYRLSFIVHNRRRTSTLRQPKPRLRGLLLQNPGDKSEDDEKSLPQQPTTSYFILLQHHERHPPCV